jgi:hypothetical protein
MELIGVHFGKEITMADKGFEIEELVFFRPMDSFDIAVVGVHGGARGAGAGIAR